MVKVVSACGNRKAKSMGMGTDFPNKNEDNTLKELNEIFLMVYGLPK